MITNPYRELEPDMTMDEIMRRWPQTIHVLLKHQLLCVGCPIAVFHTLSDAAREHDLNEALLYAHILHAIESDEDI